MKLTYEDNIVVASYADDTILPEGTVTVWVPDNTPLTETPLDEDAIPPREYTLSEIIGHMDLDTKKDRLRHQFNDIVADAEAKVLGDYSRLEQLSFAPKETEARAVLNNTVGHPTPLLSAEATTRGGGITVNSLAEVVVVKAVRYAEIAGSIAAHRSVVYDALEQSTEFADLASLEAHLTTVKNDIQTLLST